MGKIRNIELAEPKEQKLQNISENVNELKNTLAEVLDEYEESHADEKKLDLLTEALDALEDAYDALEELLLDER